MNENPHGTLVSQMKRIAQLERENAALKSALKVISTWATFNGGSELVPKHVENLCKKVLK